MIESKGWNPTINRNHLIRDAIGLGIYDCMKADPSIYLFGEGASMKMHFDCPAIEKEFPERIITLPISEDGNTDFAVGASLVGVKPVVDVVTSDFLFRTMDGICNTAPKVNFVTGTVEEEKTIVIRSENITFGLCLLPNSRVWYFPRPERVDRLSSRREIYGQTGSAQSIIKEEKLFYSGDACRIKPLLLQEYRVTSEHPFFIVRFSKFTPGGWQRKKSDWKLQFEGWLPAKELRNNDYLVVPKVRETGSPQTVTLASKKTFTNNKIYGDAGRAVVLSLDENLAKFLGWYLAEGCVQDSGDISLTVNNSKDPIDAIMKMITDLGYSPSIYEKGNASDIRFKSHLMARWLIENIGTNARNKRVPLEVFTSPEGIRKEFLHAYIAGDGGIHAISSSSKTEGVAIKTASEDLWYDTTYLLVGLGIIPSTTTGISKEHVITATGQLVQASKYYLTRILGHQISKLFGNDTRFNRDSPWQYSVEQANRFLVPISQVETFYYSGPIYNVVTTDHTYLMPVITHNTTGQRLESLFTHIPGLNVIYPSIPRDARGLIRTALRHPGVTLFFEDRMIADSDTRPEDLGDPGEDISFGRASLVHKGNRLTVVSYALTLQRARKVIEGNHLLSDCDLIDLRSLYPLDMDLIRKSVRKTGRLLVIEPDVTYSGIGAEILAEIAESPDLKLKEKPYRAGGPKTMIPASQFLHKDLIPTEERIKRVIKERLK